MTCSRVYCQVSSGFVWVFRFGTLSFCNNWQLCEPLLSVVTQRRWLRWLSIYRTSTSTLTYSLMQALLARFSFSYFILIYRFIMICIFLSLLFKFNYHIFAVISLACGLWHLDAFHSVFVVHIGWTVKKFCLIYVIIHVAVLSVYIEQWVVFIGYNHWRHLLLHPGFQ